MYNTDRTKAFKLHAVIMCKFVCIVVTPSTKKKQSKVKRKTATRNARPLLMPTEELKEMRGCFIKKRSTNMHAYTKQRFLVFFGKWGYIFVVLPYRTLKSKH